MQTFPLLALLFLLSLDSIELRRLLSTLPYSTKNLKECRLSGSSCALVPTRLTVTMLLALSSLLRSSFLDRSHLFPASCRQLASLLAMTKMTLTALAVHVCRSSKFLLAMPRRMKLTSLVVSSTSVCLLSSVSRPRTCLDVPVPSQVFDLAGSSGQTA